MRVAWFALLLITSGCDVVFGLEHPAMPIDAPGPPETVTGRWILRHVVPTSTGSFMVLEGAQPDAQVTVQFADEDPLALSLGLDGSFEFTRPAGAPYRLALTSPLSGPYTEELQLAVPHLDLATTISGRPDRQPVTTPTTLTFNAHSIPGERIILSTGVWTETPIAVNTLDWKTAGVPDAPVGLLEASRNDRIFYVVRQVFTAPSGPYVAFAAEASAQVTMVDGAPLTVPIAPQLHPRDSCAQIVAHRANAMARVRAAAGPGATTEFDDWIVQSVPVAALGPVGTLTVAFGNEINMTGSDVSLTADYRNPFTADALATIGAASFRDVRLTGTTATQVFIGSRTYVPLPSCQQVVTLDDTQGIPGTMTIDDIQLATDGVAINVPADQRPTLAWNISAVGPTDYTTAVIHEVRNVANKTVLTPVYGYRTLGRSISLGRGVLAHGKTYAIQLLSTIGHPDAARGDFSSVAYPVGRASQWSHMFKVAP